MIKITNYLLLAVVLLGSACKSDRKDVKIDSQKPLTLQTYFAPEASFGVSSTLIEGEKNLILVDAQFTLADADSVIARIQATGKNLQSIYISYNDPDFYFGLSRFREHFPTVPIYANATVRKAIQDTYQAKLAQWGPILGTAISDTVIIPDLLPATPLTLEGQAIEIRSLPNAEANSYVYVPSLKTVLGGINIFGSSFHVWLADARLNASKDRWIAVLDAISALSPSVVIPAHGDKDSALDLRSVTHTRDYIEFFRKTATEYSKSVDLIAAINAQYPTLKFGQALTFAAQVHTGELEW